MPAHSEFGSRWGSSPAWHLRRWARMNRSKKREIDGLSSGCRFADCRHLKEPGCAVRAALERGELDDDEWLHYRKLLAEAAREVTPAEVDLMVDAPQIIALELGLRFLTDYLRGDSYFKLGAADPPDLNRVRALAQLALFRRLRECADESRRFIEADRRGEAQP